jgi:hypothetical protein
MKLRLTFALLVLAAALSTSWHPVAAAGSFVCRGAYTTPSATGSGSTCTAAHSNLVSDLDSLAENDCATVRYADHSCAVTVHDTASCSCSGGVCRETAYGTHACAECGYPGGPLCL